MLLQYPEDYKIPCLQNMLSLFSGGNIQVTNFAAGISAFNPSFAKPIIAIPAVNNTAVFRSFMNVARIHVTSVM